MDQSRQEGKREVELELTLHTYGEINNGHPEVEIFYITLFAIESDA
jgi:hypothetical protein